MGRDYSDCCPVCLASLSGASIQDNLFQEPVVRRWQCGTFRRKGSSQTERGVHCIASDLSPASKRLAWLARETRLRAISRIGEIQTRIYLGSLLDEIEQLASDANAVRS